MKVAREQHSSVLESNAIHRRADSVTAVVTIVAILGANMIEQSDWLDLVGGLLISIMIAHAVAGNVTTALFELADGSFDDDIKEAAIEEIHHVMTIVNVSHEAELRKVDGVKSRQKHIIGVEMVVPGTWSVDFARGIEEAIGRCVRRKVQGVKVVHVRFISNEEPVNYQFDKFLAESSSLTDGADLYNDSQKFQRIYCLTAHRSTLDAFDFAIFSTSDEMARIAGEGMAKDQNGTSYDVNDTLALPASTGWTRPPKFTDPLEERQYLKGRLVLAFRIIANLGFDAG